MADLRVPNIGDDLMAKLKSKAALEKITLREFVIKWLQKAAK